MPKCAQCGGRLRRVHRTFFERLSYLAIYSCKDCHGEESVPRHYRLHFGKRVRCPRCGTFRVAKLKERDHIDPMHTGFLHLLERLAGGKLYHCRYCRIQFYDRRKRASDVAAEEAAAAHPTEAPSPGSAGLDA